MQPVLFGRRWKAVEIIEDGRNILPAGAGHGRSNRLFGVVVMPSKCPRCGRDWAESPVCIGCGFDPAEAAITASPPTRALEAAITEAPPMSRLTEALAEPDNAFDRMKCPLCASTMTNDEAAACMCLSCSKLLRDAMTESPAQNRKLGLFLCGAGIVCFLSAWAAFRFGGRIAIGIGLVGAMLFVLGVVGIIFGRLPLEFLDRFFGD
jgi:hypothetical protein